MEDKRKRFAAEDLRALIAALLHYFEVAQKDAHTAAEVLIDADLKGIESHGIAHLPWHRGYIPGLREGLINARASIKVLRESPTTAALDGDGGLGVVIAKEAMERCLDKAQTSGIGMVTVTNGRHFGAAGYFAEMAAKKGLIGMAMCNVPPVGVAAGSKTRAYGTNPIAFAAPMGMGKLFSLDMATTAVAGGKLEIAQRQGENIPIGWAVDSEGKPSSDPEILKKGGGLLPLGSNLETSAYKGFGLGLMVDVLSGILSGAGFGLVLPRRDLVMGQWFSAWQIEAFTDTREFENQLNDLAQRIRQIEPLENISSVIMPGDKEEQSRQDRLIDGIPLDQETIEQLEDLAQETGISMPIAMNMN